jgi:hypothetical protein
MRDTWLSETRSSYDTDASGYAEKVRGLLGEKPYLRVSLAMFAELVRDVDRNKGNVIYTKDWRVIMLDFTRGFRLQPEIRNPDFLQQCSRTLYERLQTLTREEIQSAVKNYLTGPEVAGVVARRQLIVEHFAKRIKEKGEAAVLY